jgi:hypothetical protein
VTHQTRRDARALSDVREHAVFVVSPMAGPLARSPSTALCRVAIADTPLSLGHVTGDVSHHARGRFTAPGILACSSIAGRRASGFLQVSLSKVPRLQHSATSAKALRRGTSDQR